MDSGERSSKVWSCCVTDSDGQVDDWEDDVTDIDDQVDDWEDDDVFEPETGQKAEIYIADHTMAWSHIYLNYSKLPLTYKEQLQFACEKCIRPEYLKAWHHMSETVDARELEVKGIGQVLLEYYLSFLGNYLPLTEHTFKDPRLDGLIHSDLCQDLCQFLQKNQVSHIGEIVLKVKDIPIRPETWIDPPAFRAYYSLVRLAAERFQDTLLLAYEIGEVRGCHPLLPTDKSYKDGWQPRPEVPLQTPQTDVSPMCSQVTLA